MTIYFKTILFCSTTVAKWLAKAPQHPAIADKFAPGAFQPKFSIA
jgi:hypothetical protein